MLEWIGTGSGRKCPYMKEYGDTKEMSDTEYLSMKQIADQLNVSKQRVYRCIKSNCISEAHHETVHDTVYEALLKQLEIKDQQIKELNERLAEAHKSLDQEQQLHLLSKQRIKELEEKPTEPESPDQEELAKDGFLKKLLKKYFNP